eukprot:TRINITY_DN2830_c0_g1_i6.p1 TRINITY_DN2830_c0_g1~~TRINITY_DN2830_c0_g1_i6.p1  ORF type:complete len:1280 (+),score=238.73 TRINITY_DN2830_c0_g1_i6:32-3841(+)
MAADAAATAAVKCVVVGDVGVGKTCLLTSFISPSDDAPTSLDNYNTVTTVDNIDVRLNVWDTAALAEYDQVRPVTYAKTDVFVVCFSTVDPVSCASVKSKWLPELTKHCGPGRLFLMVGTKTDLRARAGENTISREQGSALAASLGASGRYVECSAHTRQGVCDVFDEAIRCVLRQQQAQQQLREGFYDAFWHACSTVSRAASAANDGVVAVFKSSLSRSWRKPVSEEEAGNKMKVEVRVPKLELAHGDTKGSGNGGPGGSDDDDDTSSAFASAATNVFVGIGTSMHAAEGALDRWFPGFSHTVLFPLEPSHGADDMPRQGVHISYPLAQLFRFPERPVHTASLWVAMAEGGKMSSCEVNVDEAMQSTDHFRWHYLTRGNALTGRLLFRVKPVLSQAQKGRVNGERVQMLKEIVESVPQAAKSELMPRETEHSGLQFVDELFDSSAPSTEYSCTSPSSAACEQLTLSPPPPSTPPQPPASSPSSVLPHSVSLPTSQPACATAVSAAAVAATATAPQASPCLQDYENEQQLSPDDSYSGETPTNADEDADQEQEGEAEKLPKTDRYENEPSAAATADEDTGTEDEDTKEYAWYWKPSYGVAAPNAAEYGAAPVGGAQLSDFNARFQTLEEQMMALKNSETEMSRKLQLNEDLIALVTDFMHVAVTYGSIIIKERYVPEEHKTIKPIKDLGGVVGGEKYIIHNVLFKFAVNKTGIFTDESHAAKLAGHELKSLVTICNQEVPGISLPLMALIDYRGFRLIAMTVLPIDKNTLILGSRDAGRKLCACANSDAQLAMQTLSSKLNVAPHFTSADVEVFTCIDMEGHIGHDKRFYLVDFSRTFPPESPPVGNKKAAYLFELLRPELVRSCTTPLCADGFSPFIKKFVNKEVLNDSLVTATTYLHVSIIPQCARDLVEQTMNANVFSFPLKTALHSWGVNMRHMGELLQQTAKLFADKPHFADALNNCQILLTMEMIARAIRADLNAKQRQLMQMLREPLEYPFLELFVKTLRLLYTEQSGSHFTLFWRQIFHRVLEYFQIDLLQFFSAPTPAILLEKLHFSNERRGKSCLHLLLQRVLKLSGCKLEPSFANTLRHDISFIIKAEVGSIKIKERVKHMNIVSHARGYTFKLKLRCHEAVDREYSKQQTRKNFLKALEACPVNKVTLRNLAQVELEHFCDGKSIFSETAYRYFRSAYLADPTDTETLFQFGHYLLWIVRDESLGERLLLACLRGNQMSHRALYHLQQYYQRTGQETAELAEQLQRLRYLQGGSLTQ